MFDSGQKSKPKYLSWGFKFWGSFAECRVRILTDYAEVQEMELRQYDHALESI